MAKSKKQQPKQTPPRPPINLDALTLQGTLSDQMAQTFGDKEKAKAVIQKVASTAEVERTLLDDDLDLDLDLDLGTSFDDADESGTISMEQLEGSLEEGISEMLQAFKRSTAGEVATRDANINTRYWIALAFQTEAAKKEFLYKIGWLDLGDKYFCGEEIANRLGVAMTIPIPDMPNWRAKASLRALSIVESSAVDAANAE